MHVFTCQNCGQLLHFENVVCMRCGMTLGFLPAGLTLSALELAPSGEHWTALADGGTWRQCAKLNEAGCNWMVPAEGAEDFCPSCALDRTIPDLSVAGNEERWRALETAKRRLIYALKRLGLPLESGRDDSANGLAFDAMLLNAKSKHGCGNVDSPQRRCRHAWHTRATGNGNPDFGWQLRSDVRESEGRDQADHGPWDGGRGDR